MVTAIGVFCLSSMSLLSQKLFFPHQIFIFVSLTKIPNMAEHNELGTLGEELALKELLKKGYKLKDKNYRFMKGEIDLIMIDGDKLVFVEVKTRQTAEIGEPYLSVTRKKQRQIIQTAHRYIIQKDLDMDARFDIVSIVHNSYRTKIEHIDNAFYATM